MCRSSSAHRRLLRSTRSLGMLQIGSLSTLLALSLPGVSGSYLKLWWLLLKCLPPPRAATQLTRSHLDRFQRPAGRLRLSITIKAFEAIVVLAVHSGGQEGRGDPSAKNLRFTCGVIPAS